MPRLTKKQLDAVRYVSIEDFINRINQIENIDDKVAFATRYLLTYGHEGNPDVTFNEALYIARAKIADASYDLKEAFNEDDAIDEYQHLGDKAYVVNPYATENAYDMPSRTFMAHPLQYLKAHAMKLAEEIDNEDITLPEEDRLKEHYLNLAERLSDKDGPEKFEEFEKNHVALDVKVRLLDKYHTNRALNNAKSRMKSNFITRWFDSNQYNAFKQAEKEFNDPNHINYGKTEELETAGAYYLMRKFPNWNPNNGFPTEQDINRYSGKSKARIEYTINLIRCLHEYRDKEHTFDQLKYHNRNVEFEIENAFEPKPQQNVVDQSLFQEEVSKDLEDENKNEISIDNENENSMEEENEIVHNN